MTFKPNLTILPPPQLQLWPELDATPEQFTLYGGTALALRLGHRGSVDFDFFSNQPFDPDELIASIPYLKGAERVQVAQNTLKARIERDGPVLVSFFGGLGLGQVAPRDQVEGRRIYVASLLDITGTKVAVVQKRAEAKDYLDIDALIQQGIDLPTALAAGRIVYGRSFNPMITLKALSFFDDLPTLPVEVRRRLSAAVDAVDPASLPALAAYVKRTDENG
ncbi:MAG: nucleotidyl transferase AbiEii/AbiGii toxin family protein [Syntrophobacteraceae bacterium]|nr:nucleotidyl transferase AbiEii/AbiGii toxin family protein [Syntrophobacteraceae bacterium]